MARKPTTTRKTEPAAPAEDGYRKLRLGGQELQIPDLPLRMNLKVYPLVVRLIEGGFLNRLFASTDSINLTPDDFAGLVELAGYAVEAGGGTMTPEQLQDEVISVPDLCKCFLVMRLATGAWVPTPAAA